MGLSLKKGGNISLKKAASSSGSRAALTKIMVGLGWDPRVTDGSDFDLDATVFLLAHGRVRSNSDFIFYNQPRSTCGSVVHQGDNRDGEGDGDDEVVMVELPNVPSDVDKISFCVTIHEGDERRQNFGMVSNAFVRVVNVGDGKEIVRYDLSEDMSMETASVFAELYRYNGEWKFRAVGQGFSGGLEALVNNFGVQL